MSSYRLSIVTPDGEAFKGDVESLIAPGEYGSFGVLSGHAPMIISLKPGPMTVKQNENAGYYKLGSGVLEVNDESQVLVLTDSAAKVDSLEHAGWSEAAHD